MTSKPTDDEILEAVKHLGAAMLSPVEVARAVLHRWGHPTVADDPQWHFARTIEAEVRKQDDALIRQLVDALCDCAEDSQDQLDWMDVVRLRESMPNAIDWQEDIVAKAKAAIVAGRAWLDARHDIKANPRKER